MVGHSWNNCPSNGKGSKGSSKGGGGGWNSNWNGFRGKGGGNVWATEWSNWGYNDEMQFEHQAASEVDQEPDKYNDDDIELIDMPPFDTWTKVLHKEVKQIHKQKSYATHRVHQGL